MNIHKNNNSQKPENPILNLGLNIVIPIILMMKGNKWFDLSPQTALISALVFPISYGIYDFIARRKYNFFSILGFISILLTGGIGLLKLPKEWVAIKEAAIPLIIGIAILVSQKTSYPLIHTLFFNKNIIDIEKVNFALEENGNAHHFNKLLARCTYLISLSFFLSAILNFTLAKLIIKSETGTQAFTEELGKMTAWSYPIIALPCTIVMVISLWFLIGGIKKLTGLDFEALFQTAKKNPG